MTHTKFLSEKIVFQSRYFCVKQVELERDGKKLTRETVERDPIIVVLPYTQNYEVYLEKQYRIAHKKDLLEVVAGHIEINDEVLFSAKKELVEETGLSAKKWKQVATWQIGTNMKQTMHIFFATDLTQGKTQLDEDEIIETVKMPFEEALQKITTGEISVGFHVATLLLFDKLKREGKL